MPESFFDKVAGLPPTLLKKGKLWHRCFPLYFVKFLRTPILQNTTRQLLLLEAAVQSGFFKKAVLKIF